MNQFAELIVNNNFLIILIIIVMNLIINSRKLLKINLTHLYIIDALVFAIIFNLINTNLIIFNQTEVYIIITIYVAITNILMTKHFELPYFMITALNFLLIFETYSFLLMNGAINTLIYIVITIIGITIFNTINNKVMRSPVSKNLRMIPLNLITIGIILLILSQIFL